jgi:hypothetical protein
MKYLVKEADAQLEEDEDKNLKGTIEQRFRESEQLELFPEEPPPSMYQRVRIFLRDLRVSDFD